MNMRNMTAASETTRDTMSPVSSPTGVDQMKLIYMHLLDAVESQTVDDFLEMAKNVPLNNNDLAYKLLAKAFSFGRKNFIRYLLQNHCRPDEKMKFCTFSTTALHLIVKLRDVNLLEEILEMTPSIETIDSHGNSCLHLAFLHKFEEAVDLLLKYIEKNKNYSNTMKNEHGLTHLQIACTRKNTNVIHGFVNAKVDLDDSVSDSSPYWAGYTAIHFAVDFGSLEALRILQSVQDDKLKTLSTIGAKDPWQIIRGRLEESFVMSYCLKNLDPEDNGENETYFLLACLRKNPELLKKFIEVGAKVNQGIFESPFGSAGNTALHFAVKRKHEDTIKVLLQAGAMPEDKNDKSMTALHVALYSLYKENPTLKDTALDLLYKDFDKMETNVEDKNDLGYFQIAVTRNDLQAVKKLLDMGVDVNKLIKRNTDGFSHFTPLHFAVLYQHKEMVQLLIKRGADVNLTGEENEYGTPLHMAFQNGYKDLIEILLKSGANAKLVRAFDGNTILHLLASNFIAECTDPQQNSLSSDKQAILIYIEEVAQLVDVNAQNKCGKTALHNLKLNEKKCAQCLQLLLNFGADINVTDANGFLPLDLKLYEPSRCNSPEYLTFHHHVQKLEKLGLNIHANNYEICSKILDDLTNLESNAKIFNELDLKQQQMDEEVARMKSIMITQYRSLSHFLKLTPTRAASYMHNEVLEGILMQKDFDKMYPSYGYLIRLKYKSCFRPKDVDETVTRFQINLRFKSPRGVDEKVMARDDKACSPWKRRCVMLCCDGLCLAISLGFLFC